MSKLKRVGIVFSLVTVFLAVAFFTSQALGETYTSTDYKDPYAFQNDIFDTEHNDIRQMTAVQFDIHSVILFTVETTYGWDDKFLHYYIPDTGVTGQVDIGNSCCPWFKLKACVFNDVLYVYYSSSGASGALYYRTATWLYDNKSKKDTLNFSDVKTLSAAGGISAHFAVWTAQVMNGEMYLIYTAQTSSGYDVYYTKTSDGLTFQPGVSFHAISTNPGSYPLKGLEGTVFQVPDGDGGCVERMMLGYAIHRSSNPPLNCLFFDGQWAYDEQAVPYPQGLKPTSIIMIAASSKDYSDTNYAVQAWLASPKDGTDNVWSVMYHAEYYPSGSGGNEGQWSQWTLLSKSSDDHIKNTTFGDTADCYWAVIPSFKQETSSDPNNSNLRMYLDIWYGRGTGYSWPSRDYVHFRRSSYLSDILQYTGTTNVEPDQQTDLGLATVLGIIEGTPPFPINEGVPKDESENTSIVEMGADIVKEAETSITVDNTVIASYGEKFLNWASNMKFTAGLKYTHNTGTTQSLQTTTTLHSFTDQTPGDVGWALIFTPEVINHQYVQKSYDNKPLTYPGYSADDVTFKMSVIEWGGKSIIDAWPYKLENPAHGYSYSDFFQGMAARSLSTDIDYWAALNTAYENPGCCFTSQQLPTLKGSVGTTNKYEIVTENTTGDTFTPHASFSVSAKGLGFEIGDKVSFAVKMSSSTKLTGSLGYYYNVTPCGPEGGIAKINITPVLLTPKDDDTGYQAPWISDDIRNFTKPKPWCLSYLTYPLGYCDTELTELSFRNASGKIRLALTRPGYDSMDLTLHLQDVSRSFAFGGENLFHLQVGNYMISPESKDFLYEKLVRNVLHLRFAEKGYPHSLIHAVLRYNPFRGMLEITIKGRRLDLSSLAAYGLANKTTVKKGEAFKIPVSFFIRGIYHQTSDLYGTYWATEDRTGIAKVW